MDQVEEIKRKTDIVQIISEYTELKKSGRNYKGLCPFHGEKTPSFMVTPELQIYKCFGCQAGGDVYTFLMELEKLEFPQVLKLLADRLGIQLIQTKGFASFEEKDTVYTINFLASEFYHYLLTKHQIGEKARNYLKERGVTDKAIEIFKLGFSPTTPDAVFKYLTQKKGYKGDLLEKSGIVVRGQGGYYDRFRGRVIFPLKDHFGNSLGFAGRILEAKGDVAKYINSPETLAYKKSRHLYGLDVTRQAIKKQGFAVVVEGEIDCISSWQAGIENVVAIKGSAFTEEQAQLIARFTDRVVLALDADFAGNEAAKRGLDNLQKQGITVQIVNLGEFKDPDEAARQNPQFLEKAINQAEGVYDFLINLVFKRIDTNTTEGKSKASRELSPILASIEDEIVRASCIRIVAQRLQVPEEAVVSQIRKQGQPQRIETSFAQPKTETIKTRRDLLEDHFLAYSFKLDLKKTFEEDMARIIKSQARLRLIEEVRKIYAKNDEADLQELASSIAPEFQDFLAKIVLFEVEDDRPEYLEKELAKIKNEIEILDIKERMGDIMRAIKDFEEKEEDSQVLVLEQELSQLGQKLSLLEAQF